MLRTRHFHPLCRGPIEFASGKPSRNVTFTALPPPFVHLKRRPDRFPGAACLSKVSCKLLAVEWKTVGAVEGGVFEPYDLGVKIDATRIAEKVKCRPLAPNRTCWFL